MKFKLKDKYKIAFKAMLLTTIILLTNFIQIWWLSFGKVQIVNFRCDAQLIGYKRYKADVFEEYAGFVLHDCLKARNQTSRSAGGGGK